MVPLGILAPFLSVEIVFINRRIIMPQYDVTNMPEWKLRRIISQKDFYSKKYYSSISRENFQYLKSLLSDSFSACWNARYAGSTDCRTMLDYRYDQLELFWLRFELNMYIALEQRKIFEENSKIKNASIEPLPVVAELPFGNRRLVFEANSDLSVKFCEKWKDSIFYDFQPRWSAISPHSPHRLDGDELHSYIEKNEISTQKYISKLSPAFELIRLTGVVVKAYYSP